MSTIVLDTVEKVEVVIDEYLNEIRTLEMLTQGLLTLANTVKSQEEPHKEVAKGQKSTQLGPRGPEERPEFDLVACTFHWFAVSVCNYARLVGFIRGLNSRGFLREDLMNPSGRKRINEGVSLYVDSITELKNVVKWRNKVGAHFAITAPQKKDDNIATLNMSVMFQLARESGIYHVNTWGLMQGTATGHHVSDIPSWSLTEVFAELIPRYWPQFVLGDSTEENPEGGTP